MNRIFLIVLRPSRCDGFQSPGRCDAFYSCIL